jgi:hypothetical protein
MTIKYVGAESPQVYDKARYGGAASISKSSRCPRSLAVVELTILKSRICLRCLSTGSNLNPTIKITLDLASKGISATYPQDWNLSEARRLLDFQS